MDLSWLPPIFVMCNATHEKDRYEFLRGHFPSRGIPLEKIHWITGPWGCELTAERVLEVYDPFRPRFGLVHALSFKSAALSKGEISLVLTFMETVRAALACGADRVIVFESDVFLREDFLTRLKLVLEDDSGMHSDSDYISLGEGVGTRPDGVGASYFRETRLYNPPHEWVFRCTDSMVFRRKFLEKVVQTLIPFRECLDWELNVQMLLHRGKALWADPPLVEPGSGRWRNLSHLPG